MVKRRWQKIHRREWENSKEQISSTREQKMNRREKKIGGSKRW